MNRFRRLFSLVMALASFWLASAACAQDDEGFDLILIKEIHGGAQTEDANFISIMESAVTQWVSSVGKVLEFYERELPGDRTQRSDLFRRHGIRHSLQVRFIKSESSAALMFVILAVRRRL